MNGVGAGVGGGWCWWGRVVMVMSGSGDCSTFPRALLHSQKRSWFWGIQESRDVDVEEQDDDGGNGLSSEYNTEPREYSY